MKNITLSSEACEVVTDRVFEEEITKACHEGIGSVQKVRMPSGHFSRDSMGTIVPARLCFPHILSE